MRILNCYLYSRKVNYFLLFTILIDNFSLFRLDGSKITVGGRQNFSNIRWENLRSYSNQTVFYNFYRTNNRWAELKVNDLLNIQGDNRWKMNDLITKKVKALKDKQIDCSNAEAFIKTVEDRWQLTREGINFCFESSDESYKFVVVSFTWAELSPFLKFKIY
jgi:hypothetical protein